jgi:hypothetical protein
VGTVARTFPGTPRAHDCNIPQLRTHALRDGEKRGRYFTLEQATEAYPIFTLRLLRRLVEERRIAFSRAGRRIVLAERDIEHYLEAHRVEPRR